MKTMTCRQLGGPCDLLAQRGLGGRDHQGAGPPPEGDCCSEVTEHQSALQDMKGRWKNPIAGMGWYRQVKRDFKALP